MTAILKYFELASFSLVNFIPFFILTVYPFRNSFKISKRSAYIIGFALAIIHTLINLFYLPYVKQIIIIIPKTFFFCAFFLLLTRVNLGKAMFASLCTVSVQNFVNVASKCLENMVFPDYATQHFRFSYTVCMLIVEFAVLVPIFYANRIKFTEVIESKTLIFSWRYLWAIPLTFCAVWIRNLVFGAEGASVLALRFRYTVFSFVVNAGAYIIYGVVVRMITEAAENEQHRIRKQQHIMQRSMYESIHARIEETRKLKHDLRHHLNIMNAYLQSEKYDELREYFGRYIKNAPLNDSLVYCENFTVNSLLHHFSWLSHENGIAFSANTTIPKECGVSEEVLTVVLGNLIENAYEACTREKTEGQIISVRGMCDNGNLFFKIVNTASNPVKPAKGGAFRSSKHKGNGIGFQSARDLAEESGGMLKAEWNDGKFTVSVLLKPSVK